MDYSLPEWCSARSVRSGRGLALCALSVALLGACAGHAVRGGSGSIGGAGATASSGGAGSGGAGDAGGAGAWNAGPGEAGAWDTCLNALGPVGVSVTPRADTNLELLALKFSPEFVAQQTTYERIVRDVAAIRAEDAAVRGIEYFPPHDGRQLLLSVEQPAFAEMQQNTYQAWDCLNQALVLQGSELSPARAPFSPSVVLTLKGIYDLNALAKLYGALTGIISASPNLGAGDGPTICLTREADIWHYVFDQASGDCPAGCIDHTYRHFSTDGEGGVSALGALTSAPQIALYASQEACR